MSVYRFVSAEKAQHPGLPDVPRVLGVSRSGFYDWAARAPSTAALADAWLTEPIREIHEANREVYGSPRVHAELRLGDGVRVGRKRVERLMRQAGLSGLVKRRSAAARRSVCPGVRVADDLVERDFTPTAPNVLWCADITYLRTWEGWLYLAAVQDAYSRPDRRLGDGRPHARRARRRRAADGRRAPPARRRASIHHCDQGSQPGLKGSSQHRVIGERTVASERTRSRKW